MDSLQDHLVELSDRLDNEGKQSCADAVDRLIKSASLQKVAQYVGVIGYVLKQNRAMGNCIRKKRVASSEPMQTVVLQCLKEYQDGQNYQDTEWASKYAQVIQHDPKQFDVSHLVLLSALADSGNIDGHIQEVEKVASLLKQNDVEDELFDTLLGHLSTFGDILAKDSETHVNFKVAASPRGWWSRFWNPTQFSLTNPRSWSKNVRERGQDLDAIQELEAILTNLSALTRITMQVRTAIGRLKSEANGYTSGSGHELSNSAQPVQDDQNIINTIVKKIMALQSDDWNKSMLLLQQMRHLMDNSTPQNYYNKQIFDRANTSVDRIFSSMEEIYKLLENIQSDMETLRTRQPILGRESGLTEKGQRNPFGITSPAEEYGALEQVLEKLYENPMDRKAQWYAQKAHARLWDKLRYIQRGADEGMNEWLKEEHDFPRYPTNEPPTSPPSEFTEFDDVSDIESELGSIDDPVTTVPGASPSEQPQLNDIDEFQRKQFDNLRNTELLEMSEKGHFTNNEVMSLLNYLGIILSGSQAGEEVDKLAELLKRKLDGEDNLTTEIEENTGSSYSPEEEDEYRPIHRTRLQPQAKLDKYTLIKIADAVDRVDSDVADALDALINEYENDEINLLFPEFGVPVKEQAVK